MNVGNVLIVLLSTVLMDRVGRKPLLLLSLGAMAVACVLLTISLFVENVPLVCLAMILFVMGPDRRRLGASTTKPPQPKLPLPKDHPKAPQAKPPQTRPWPLRGARLLPLCLDSLRVRAARGSRERATHPQQVSARLSRWARLRSLPPAHSHLLNLP